MQRHAPAPRTVLAVSSLGVFVAFVDATIVNIAFPDIALSFPDASIGSLSWVLNAYNIVFAAFLVPAGRIADLIGRRRTFLFGLALFTLSSGLCAIAPSVTALVAFRVLQALGAALLVPSSLALVLAAFPPERRSHAVAMLSAIGAAAAGIGPSLGGLLVSASNWRLVFLVNLPVGIAAYVLSRRHLVESREPGRRRLPDLVGATVFGLSVGLLVLGVIKGDEWGWTGAGTLATFGLAVVMGALFVWRCTWHRSPIVDLSLLRVRTFTAANALTVIGAAGFFGYTLCNVLYLTGVWQYSVLEAGLALTPGPVVAVIVAGPASHMVERFGHRIVLVVGGTIWGTGLLWFVTQVGTTPAFVSEWLPGMVIMGIGAGISFPNLSGAAVASAPGEAFATATGLNSVARQVGAALGVAIVVAIIGQPTSVADATAVFDNAWTFAAACLFATGVGSLLIGRVHAGDDVGRTPSFARAARAVLAEPAPTSLGPSTSSAMNRRPSGLVAALVPRSHPESVAEFLGATKLFANVAAPLRDAIAARSTTRHLPAGEWLFHQGDPGDAMYVVRAGRLEVVADDQVVRELGRGAALGELALLTSSPRSLSVRASRESDLIAIEANDFERLLADSPELSRSLNRTLASQLRSSRGTTSETRALPTTVALVPLDDGVPVEDIGRRLAAALGGNAAALDGSETGAPVDRKSSITAYGPLLDRFEAQHDRLVLMTASPFIDDPWTDFCLQQTDRILAISSGRPVAEGAAQRADLRGCDLVAYDVEVGSGAVSGWAELLQPVETHALAGGHALDDGIERTARRLTGRSVGVVLSGGGARAFSHIGVLEELVAAGIVIDRVAGVSMGAYVGGMFAMGMDFEEIDARCYDEWIRRRPLGDYTLPRHSLIRGDRVEAMLHRTFGTACIEELERSFFCAYSDLRSSQLVLSRSGPLWDCVGSSVCMPVLAAPRVRGRELIADGSLIDNLPVGSMAALGEGPVIAVDVKATFDPGSNGNGNRPAPPREQRTPALGETLTRVLLLGSAKTSDAARRHADFVIKPRNDGIGLLEFHQLDRARESGRRAAVEALEGAPDLLFA